MRTYSWLILSIGLTAAAVGCGDSGSNGAGGSAGTGGSSGTATVSGTVFVASLDDSSTTLEGATVAVVGGASTTSGADGEFTLEAPIGITQFLTTAPDAWGELQTGDVPPGGTDMAEAEVVPDTLVAAVAGVLGETIDPAKGIVTVELDQDVAVGGESADLGSDYGFAFVFDPEGNPQLGTGLAAGADPVVIFVNVDITSDVMPSAEGAGGIDCALDVPGATYPAQAKVFTVVDFTCP